MKDNRSVKLKGTVLYTVISVLMVLIVFLMGTLALAATASNRAMNNYNSAQTQYTAKAAVEAIMSAMQNNKDVATAAAGVSETNKVLTVQGITFEDSSLGTVQAASIEYAGKKWILEDDTESDDYGKMVEKTIVKISATVGQGRESSTVAAYVLKDASPSTPIDGNNNGFVSTGGALTDNHVSAFGGTYLGFDALFADPTYVPAAPLDFKFVNGEAIETDMQVNGNLFINNGSMTLVFKEPGTGLTVWGNMEINKELYVKSVNATTGAFPAAAGKSYRELPYIYVEKNLAINCDNVGVGVSDVPLNIFCGDLDVNGNGGKTIYADVYCYDKDGESVFKPGGGNTQLYKWTANIMNAAGTMEAKTSGNFYSKGDLTVQGNGATFQGDVCVEGDVVIAANTTIEGDLKVGGKLTASNLTVTGTVYCDDITGYGGANVQQLRPGVDPTKTIPGYNALNPGYTQQVLYAMLDDNFTYQPQADNPWWTYQVYAFVDHLGNLLQVIDNRYEPAAAWTLQPDNTYLRTNPDGSTAVYPIPTYVVFFDDTMTQVPEFEATTWVEAQYFNAAGQPITTPALFPAEYEKEIILGQATLTGHDTTADTKIISTVSDVLLSSANPYNTLHEIPSSYQDEVNANVFTLGGAVAEKAGYIKQVGDTYEVTGSCTIQGNLNQQTVKFKVPTGTEIWVKVGAMSNSNNSQFIQDDSDPNYRGTVNLLLTGDLRFTGNNKQSITTTTVENLLSSTDAFQLYTNSAYAVPGVPTLHGVNMNVYSENAEHTLAFQNSTTLAANIKAPYLTIRIESGGGKAPSNPQIYYNGFDVLSDANSKNLGCIGCCIIKEFYSQNNWTLLYVGKAGSPGGGDFDDAIMKNWSILYYDNY